MAIFDLHYIKVLIFHAHAVDMQKFYEFTNLNSSKLQSPCEIS